MGFYEFISRRFFQVFINMAYMLLGIPMTVFLIIFPLYLVILGFIPTEALAVSSARIMFMTFLAVTFYLEISFISRLLADYLEDRDFSDMVQYIDRNIDPDAGSSNNAIVADRVASIQSKSKELSAKKGRSLFSFSKRKPFLISLAQQVSYSFQYYKLFCAIFFPSFILAILFVNYFNFSLIKLFWEVLIIAGSLMFILSLFVSRFLLNLFEITMINTNSPLRRKALGESYSPGSLRGLLVSFSLIVLITSLLFSKFFDGSADKYVFLIVLSSIGALPLYLSPFFRPFHPDEEIFI
ncbi:MAG: hypothetical protein ACTSYA_05705 [Candidatus Kariarchaeaceae archaeon]